MCHRRFSIILLGASRARIETNQLFEKEKSGSLFSFLFHPERKWGREKELGIVEPEQHQKRSISEIHAGLGRSALSSAMMSLLRFSTGPGSPPEGDHFSLRELSFLHPFFLFFVRAPEHILLPLHRPGFSAVQLSFYVFSPLFRSSHSFNVLLLSSHIT